MQHFVHPTLWRTCRVLSNPVRLRVLQAVVKAPGSSVSDVRRICHLPQSSASHHLRQLQARGLLTARTVGSRVTYTPQTDPAVGHADLVFASVQHALSRGETPTATGQLLKALTHARRITIVRVLHQAPAAAEELIPRCNISRPAIYRHLDNLVARAVVCGEPDGVFQLNPNMPQLARDLVHIVCAA